MTSRDVLFKPPSCPFERDKRDGREFGLLQPTLGSAKTGNRGTPWFPSPASFKLPQNESSSERIPHFHPCEGRGPRGTGTPLSAIDRSSQLVIARRFRGLWLRTRRGNLAPLRRSQFGHWSSVIVICLELVSWNLEFEALVLVSCFDIRASCFPFVWLLSLRYGG